MFGNRSVHRVVGALGLVYLLVAANSQSAFAFPVKMGLSPDNSRDLLISTLRSATRSLIINVYQWDSDAVTQTVIDQITRGVTVQILLEGSPVGGVSAGGEQTIAQITGAMRRSHNKGDHFYVMSKDAGAAKRRFRYDHAKYVVVDGNVALVASENFTSTGHPTPGDVGNRGWEILLQKPELAQQLSTMFQGDISTSYNDVEDVTQNTFNVKDQANTETHRKVNPIAQQDGDAQDATIFTSPNSLTGLQNAISLAHHALSVEFMSLPSTWKNGSSDEQSPLIDSILKVARAGANVRVLLNDESTFGSKTPDDPNAVLDFPGAPKGKQKPNEITIALLNHLAQCEHLPLEARTVDVHSVQITYIHNKGMVMDGEYALINSINGTENAVMNNREVAVLVHSPDAAKYFGGAFDFDWEASAAAIQEMKACNPTDFGALFVPGATPGMFF